MIEVRGCVDTLLLMQFFDLPLTVCIKIRDAVISSEIQTFAVSNRYYYGW